MHYWFLFSVVILIAVGYAFALLFAAIGGIIETVSEFKLPAPSKDRLAATLAELRQGRGQPMGAGDW